jgi:hypothetical protein
MKEIDWSQEQLSVIEESGDSRLLVDAGPGTGKTAVACKRIASLVDSGFCHPHEIIVVSFTNTAVYEIRERIKSYISDASLVSNIRVTTLDSFAGKLRAGFDSIGKVAMNFDENISRASRLIFTEPDVSDFVKTIKHIVIDEAQDIVGERSLFVLELISKMDLLSGVTIFADEAQAIYGFTNDSSDEENSRETLPQSISRYNSHLEREFNSRSLDHVYRTENVNMQKLFSDGRSLLRKSNAQPNLVYEELRRLIVGSSDIDLPTVQELLEVDENDPDEFRQNFTDIFMIFRKRGEALQASTHLGAQPRRMRLSGLPIPLKPWVADVFWNYEDDEISESTFMDRFNTQCGSKGYDLEAQLAWELILKESGISKTKVSVRNLRTKLARYSPNPDFIYPDFGIGGPIFSSIHAAKGRESKGVLLFLPKQHIRSDATPEEIMEEARVLFVGATRAKEEVLVFNGEDYTPISSLKTTGRAFSYLSKKRSTASVEIGRKEDLTAFSLVGAGLFEDYADVAAAQRSFRLNPFEILELTALSSGKDLNYSYKVLRKQKNKSRQGSERPLFFFDQAVNRDLFTIGRFIGPRIKPPGLFTSFYSLGVRSYVIPAGDIRLDDLHEPWKSSGFLHAPMISGYPYMQFDRMG